MCFSDMNATALCIDCGCCVCADMLPLHCLCVTLLLQSGDTALHLACFHGYLDIAKLLVKHGANLHTVNKVRSTDAQHGSLQTL